MKRTTVSMMKIQMTKWIKMKMNEIDELYVVLDGYAMHGQHHAHDTQTTNWCKGTIDD